MMINSKILLVSFFSVYTLLIHVSSYASDDDKNIALVLGYFNQVKNKTWENSHVGFGVQNQLKQAIYNSDKFLLKEEKNIIRNNTNQTNSNSSTNQVDTVQEDTSWMIKKENITDSNLNNKAKLMEADLIFWVEVLSFGKLNSKLYFGPFSSSTKRTNLVVKVCAFNSHSKSKLCEFGIGKSRRKSSSFFFKLKEHRKGEKLFDGSKVGKISNVAVIKATKKLLKSL